MAPTQFSLYIILFLSFTTNCLGVEELKRSQFPDGFHFGTATSAYQIEGAYKEDGKSLSNWDVFNHIHGKNEDSGDVANDHYHRFSNDIDMMHDLGVNSYRFSLSWSRILPSGMFGKVNQGGITFYNKLIDDLLLRGIEPFVTIHHHDLPQILEDNYGSWLSPMMQREFVYFADICFKNFGDRVKYWATINEPNLFAKMAYVEGIYPPARCSTPFGKCAKGNSGTEHLIAMHNMLLGHAKITKLYRKKYQPKQNGFIGMVASTPMYEPLNDNEHDRDAVKRALAYQVAWVFDPLVHGDYPQEMKQYHGDELPKFTAEESKLLKGSIDFIGANHYTTFYAKDCIHSACPQGGNTAVDGFVYTTVERDGVPIGEPTGFDIMFVVPRGMEGIIGYLKNRYNNMPIYVTENGYALQKQKNDQTQMQYELNDVKRVEFHKAYLASLSRAIRDGADVRGYFIWSLMDNYEWVQGYRMKFGLFYTDRQTLTRSPKLSAKWYKEFLTNSPCSTNNNNQNESKMISSSLEKDSTLSLLKGRKADI